MGVRWACMSSPGFVLSRLPATHDLKCLTALDGLDTSPWLCSSRKWPYSSWTGNATLFRKDFLPSSYKEQVVRTKGWVHNDVQASPLCSGFQVVRISHFLPCWQNWNEPPLIHDSPIRALTVSFHCGSDTLRSGSQALELLWVACDKMGLFGYRKNLLYWMFLKVKSESESCSVVSDSLHPPRTV